MLSKFISARQEKSGIGVSRANTETITVNTDDNRVLRVKPPDTRVSCSFFFLGVRTSIILVRQRPQLAAHHHPYQFFVVDVAVLIFVSLEQLFNLFIFESFAQRSQNVT